MSIPSEATANERDRVYWQRTLRLTGVLLVLWFILTFGLGFFAEQLDFRFFGWPFSFWMAAQGALIVYCGIVWYYAYAMARLDRTFGVVEHD